MRYLVVIWFLLALIGPLCAQEPSDSKSPDAMARFAKLLERDWQQQPEWAQMAIAILKGDGGGSGLGWFTGSQRRYDWSWLAATFPEAAADERIEAEEIPQLDQDSFRRIDTDGDKGITPADFDFSKNPLMEDESPAGDIFSRLDNDSNGRLTMDELQRWFDRAADGSDFLSVEDLKAGLGLEPPSAKPKNAREDRPDPRWRMMELLLNGEMGSFAAGPDLDTAAPELDLPLLEHKEDGGLELTDRFIKLADVHGERPVVLIFGSFT